MEQKTKINAEDGKQELAITREFDLPLELLFKAYIEPELLQQWMGTRVLKLESKKHGSYQFETTDPQGNKYAFNGVIHEFSPNRKIIRTFEMENTPFGVQLEFLEFEKLTAGTSRLNMHVVYESVAQRDQVLKLPLLKASIWPITGYKPSQANCHDKNKNESKGRRLFEKGQTVAGGNGPVEKHTS